MIFLDILNQKVYNINRVGENVVSVEEYDAASVDSVNFTVIDPKLAGTMHYSFDSDGKQFRKKYVAADGTEQKYVFEFRDEQNVAVQLPTGAVSHAKTDHLGRKVFDEIQLRTGLMNRTFTYHEGAVTKAHETAGKQVSEPTTTLVKEIRFHDGRTIAYEYDAEERITKVTDSADGVTEYTYDALGQLLTETVDGTTVSAMTYDKYGNILTKNSIAYTYGNAKWKDLLTAYNGKAITYDANGNPINYQGTAATWEKGRQLKTFGANSYKYNNDGIRIQKRTATEIHDYILDGTNILKELVTDTGGCPKYTNEYLYDLDGTVCGIKHNGTAYYFYKNLQGDVIAITDANGAVVARYTYDAWGVPTIKEDTSGCNIATVNPFRYRGYYYDTETKLYYLQSRYYDPEIGRFINADEAQMIRNINSESKLVNLLAYCENDVVNCVDLEGFFSLKGVFKKIKEHVKFGWFKITITLNRVMSIVLGILSLLLRLGMIVSDIKDMQQVVNNKVGTAIVAALPYGGTMVTGEIISWLCNVGAVVAILSAVFTFVLGCCTGGIFKIVQTIFSFILSYILPTIIASVCMIYYGFKKGKGCNYTINLLGGSSVSFS